MLPNHYSTLRKLKIGSLTVTFTFLVSITSFGYIKQDDEGSYTRKNLPPTEFEYQKHHWNDEIKTIASEDLVHAPVGLDESQYQFTDLYNEGLSGILTEQGGGWFYKHNLGGGRFEQAKSVSPKPSFTGLGSQLQLMDLDADGGKQVVNLNNEPKGYFELNDDEWLPFRTFETLPNINMGDPNTRMLDLNGDGRSEVLITEDNLFTWYESTGRKGYKAARKTVKPFDEEAGPHIVFADSTQTIFLADMSGDGLSDIVRIRNGEVCYWPNMGYGDFGKKIGMDHAPIFDHPETFNPAYLRLADIDGSRTTDIIYLGKNRFTCWLNMSGNEFGTEPFEIDNFPEIHNLSRTTVTDLLGNGVACIVWSTVLSKDSQTPLQYIDLMNSKKPHIMIGYKNNLGKEVSLKYAPSTRFYIEDKLAGRPWVTKLHFPVHCVKKTETRDVISGYRFITSYRYHHGYYDHIEREFRGFGMVEQIDAEHFEHWKKGDASNIVDRELHQEPVITKNWFHTGAFLEKERILDQFASEYWYEEVERYGYPVTQYEMPLPDARLISAPGLDPSIIDDLSIQEWHEALRACKGMALRSEIFANDAPLSEATPEQIRKEFIPYTVATHNCVIELLQPQGQNKHAIFIVKESEAVTYSYERNPEDPRISHNLNIKLDEYGNVEQAASVVYPRKIVDTSLPSETQDSQNKTLIIYTENRFTNDINSPHDYRLRVPSEVKTYELKGVHKDGEYYGLDDFGNILDDSAEVLYHQKDAEPSPGSSQKRLIEHVRTLFYNDQLIGPLLPDQLGPKGIPFESYQLAYTPALITDIFDTRDNEDLMREGKFMQMDGNWWIRSGTTQFIEEGTETVLEAQDRFYAPISFTDPYGAKTTVTYDDGNYFLFIKETEDALGNKTEVENFNFRTLSPTRMIDINNNISEVMVDELGLVKAMALFGKGSEADDFMGLNEFSSSAENDVVDDFFNAPTSDELVRRGNDLLQHATARFVYDFDVYKNSGKPVVVASIVREDHFQQNSDSPVQISFEYSNGLGQVVMKKSQAEPGLAKQVTVNSDDTYTITDIDTSSPVPQLRWIGNGRTVLNNKGNAVKQYEPYFSVTHQYEDLKELVETGVTPVMYYDAAGRLIKTELPGGTLSRTEFDSWKQVSFDPNDTVLESSWYQLRTDPLLTDKFEEKYPETADREKQQVVANKARAHAYTPTTQHLDTLGRPILSIEHNKNIDTDEDEYYRTKVELDIEGNLLSVTDARNNMVMSYKYDMLGNQVYQNSMDAGERYMLNDVAGQPFYSWDVNERVMEDGSLALERRRFHTSYDQLHRPLEQRLQINGGQWHVVERFVYGESPDLFLSRPAGEIPESQERNLRGQVYQHYDASGLVRNQRFDFKGNLLEIQRQLASAYREAVINWLESPSASALESDIYTQNTKYDALNRMTRQENWHLADRIPAIYIPQYDQRGILSGESLSVRGEVTQAILNIEYDAKGQRQSIKYGNDTVSDYRYDPETFRLVSLTTTHTRGNPVLQDLHYTYDPVGNITEILDKAQQTVYFANTSVVPDCKYEYDALYRLIRAEGREHAVQNNIQRDNTRFEAIPHIPFPNSPEALQRYIEIYQYDSVGNILSIAHSGGSVLRWKRCYQYAEDSNRLLATGRPGDLPDPSDPCSPHYVTAPTLSQRYEYDTHGSMLNLNHTEEEYRLRWDYHDMLHHVNLGGGGQAWYNYDAGKQRSRKRIEHNGNTVEERLYLGGMEHYLRWVGGSLVEEIETHDLFADDQHVLIVEDVLSTDNSNLDAGILYRYQYGNHLGSVGLELDGDGAIISYEEYHPYGTTAYRANNQQIRATWKRFRYTGMERDEETGLSYHTARYYLSWLGRWGSVDPIDLAGGANLYQYVRGNSTNSTDQSGTGPREEALLLYLLSVYGGVQPPPPGPPNDEPTESLEMDESVEEMRREHERRQRRQRSRERNPSERQRESNEQSQRNQHRRRPRSRERRQPVTRGSGPRARHRSGGFAFLNVLLMIVTVGTLATTVAAAESPREVVRIGIDLAIETAVWASLSQLVGGPVTLATSLVIIPTDSPVSQRETERVRELVFQAEWQLHVDEITNRLAQNIAELDRVIVDVEIFFREY